MLLSLLCFTLFLDARLPYLIATLNLNSDITHFTQTYEYSFTFSSLLYSAAFSDVIITLELELFDLTVGVNIFHAFGIEL